MIIICAWCPDFDPTDPRNAEASHGMCPTCAARMTEEWLRDDAGRRIAPASDNAALYQQVPHHANPEEVK